MAEIAEKQLTELLANAMNQAIDKRRADTAHIFCICADPKAKKRHEEEHEALRSFMKLTSRLSNMKWGLYAVVIGFLALAALGGIGAALLHYWKEIFK